MPAAFLHNVFLSLGNTLSDISMHIKGSAFTHFHDADVQSDLLCWGWVSAVAETRGLVT